MKFGKYKYEQYEIPDPCVLDVADQFYKGAMVLHGQPAFSGVVVPMITNAVLSLELYIKSLNTISVIKEYEDFGNGVKGGKVTGVPRVKVHTLSLLLGAIPKEVIDNINEIYAEGASKYSFDDLIELVKKYDTLFVDVRYSFENDVLAGFNFVDLFNCIDAIKTVIKNIKPIHWAYL
ncbi:hypothetical protein SAMN05660337_3307 [Maridesulfovibrio ferrireducens]|uniref:Uncharacterized protein n=1 Tax=Maridesulfovibrio ferrireducens TaxID=246191 RepID=A0A1G9L7H1_9BACT|nr:hypothetical protein [Maridesulfovibrio ferrireducens]SDL57707.1 hypothetical protein SAMN05660337_3307 [Maridesulfovibrio ferrireducens]